MNRFGVSIIVAMLVLFVVGIAFGGESSVTRDEMETLNSRLNGLEKAIEQQGVSISYTEGEEQWYEKIEIAIGATGVLQGLSGADETMSPEGDIIDASMSFDMEISIPVAEDGSFYSLMEAGSGEGIDTEFPALSGFNGDADDDSNVRLSEVWYEHNWSDERLRLRIGKIDLTTDFDVNEIANSETDQFLSGGFINNLAVEFPDDNGFGAMFWASPSDLIDIGVGIADTDADWEDVFEDVFSIVTFDFKPLVAERQGNYRIYGWINSKDHEHLTDSAKTEEDNYGIGLSLDQEITDTMVLFARFGQQSGDVSQIEQAWSVGLQCSGECFRREDDTFGFAYGMAVIGDDWKDIDAGNGIDSDDEHHAELYYNMKVNDNLNISPDIQWVKNPNGNKDIDDVLAFAVRTQLSF